MLNNLYPDINGNSYTISGMYMKINRSYYASDVNGVALENAYEVIDTGSTIGDIIIIAGLRPQVYAVHKKNTYLTCHYKKK